jgi:hypothetical protein
LWLQTPSLEQPWTKHPLTALAIRFPSDNKRRLVEHTVALHWEAEPLQRQLAGKVDRIGLFYLKAFIFPCLEL